MKAEKGVFRPAPPTDEYVEGQVIVKFRDDTTEAELVQINDRIGGTIAQKVEIPGMVFLVHLRKDLPVPVAIEKYRAHKQVEYAEPNYRVRAMGDPGAR